MNQPCLIIFDIDETLYSNHKREIPASTLFAIKRLKKAGHTLAIATGRAPFEFLEEIKNLDFDFHILANGQIVKKGDEIIYENAIDKKIVVELMDVARKKGVHLGFNSKTHSSVTGLTDDMRKAFETYYANMPEITDCIEAHSSIYQMWYLSEDIDEIKEQFIDKLQFFPWLNNGADIVPHGSSKATGLTAALELLKGSIPKKIIFFGDGLNDYDLIKMADIGVAMGNASPILKEIADLTTLDIVNDGIYHACEFLNLFEEVSLTESN